MPRKRQKTHVFSRFPYRAVRRAVALDMIRTVAVTRRAPLFQSGTGAYHTFRIPALVTLGNGVVLVAAEGRRDALSDYGQIDLVVRRSTDGGKTFDAARTLVSVPGFTSGNPTWLFDAASNVLVLMFCRNVASHREALVFAGQGERTVWVCLSYDAGRSFTEPREITAQVKPADWTWYATGPGHGLALCNGRWVVPCCHALAVTRTHDDPVRSHLIVSDDKGASWRLGGIVQVLRSSECGLAETRPNELYVDFRNDAAPHNRGGAYSADAGDTFAWQTLHANVADPGCRGGVTAGTAPGEVWLTHARGPERRELVLEYSADGGWTFEHVMHLVDGCAAYSDVVRVGGKLLCATETGVDTPYERIDLLEIE